MNILVFGKTQESANYKLDNILKDIPFGEVKVVRKNKYDYNVELNNGIRYIAKPATQNARGFRCHKAYVEYGIDREIFDCVIMPILCVSDLPLDKQVEWF